jgi:hypothetical protein
MTAVACSVVILVKDNEVLHILKILNFGQYRLDI